MLATAKRHHVPAFSRRMNVLGLVAIQFALASTQLDWILQGADEALELPRILNADTSVQRNAIVLIISVSLTILS